MTITGTGFNADCSRTQVSIGNGGNCPIVSCTDSEIKCIVGPMPLQPSPLTSTTGLVLKLWWNSLAQNSINAFLLDSRYPNSPDTTMLSLNGLQGYRQNFAEYYLQQV